MLGTSGQQSVTSYVEVDQPPEQVIFYEDAKTSMMGNRGTKMRIRTFEGSEETQSVISCVVEGIQANHIKLIMKNESFVIYESSKRLISILRHISDQSP